MTHLTQLTKRVMYNIYDKIHFIFLLVVGAKHFSNNNNNNRKKIANALRVFVLKKIFLEMFLEKKN